jgi:hypothetical protein
MAGYSGTPLSKKLGIKPGTLLHVVNEPVDYAALLEPLPENVAIAREATDELDIVHVFVKRRSELIDLINIYLAQEGGEDRHGCHRGHGARGCSALGPRRHQSLRDRRRLVGLEAGDSQRKPDLSRSGSFSHGSLPGSLGVVRFPFRLDPVFRGGPGLMSSLSCTGLRFIRTPLCRLARINIRGNLSGFPLCF